MSIVYDYSLWRHLKTGNLYRAVWGHVINATNAQDGQVVVQYRREDCMESGDARVYVRERQEFLQKFEPVEEILAEDDDA